MIKVGQVWRNYNEIIVITSIGKTPMFGLDCAYYDYLCTNIYYGSLNTINERYMLRDTMLQNIGRTHHLIYDFDQELQELINEDSKLEKTT